MSRRRSRPSVLLPEPGLSDEGERFASIYGQRHTVDGVHLSGVAAKESMTHRVDFREIPSVDDGL